MNTLKSTIFKVLKEGSKAVLIGITIDYFIKKLEEKI